MTNVMPYPFLAQEPGKELPRFIALRLKFAQSETLHPLGNRQSVFLPAATSPPAWRFTTPPAGC